MYLPTRFELKDQKKIETLLREYSFASLISVVDGQPICTQLPFLYDSAQNNLIGHLALNNPHAKALKEEGEALVVFQGPHGYISPDWYEDPNDVPTWNYVSIHVSGKVQMITDYQEVEMVLESLVKKSESENGTGWSYDFASAMLRDSLLKAIVAFRIKIDRLEAKAKLSQNHSVKDIQNVILGLQEKGNTELAQWIGEVSLASKSKGL